MTKVAVVYHSEHGHAAKQAQAVASGAGLMPSNSKSVQRCKSCVFICWCNDALPPDFSTDDK